MKLTQAQAKRPSPPSFRISCAPVEVSRDTNSANLVIEATDQARFESIIAHSGGPTIPGSGYAVYSATVIVLRLRAAHKAWVRAAIVSDTELKLHQELSSYAQLEDNWDGEGAKAPSQAAIDDALSFLERMPSNIPLPYPEEGKEGDVGIYWDNPKAKVFTEVSFEGNGTFSYFAVHGVPSEIIEKFGRDNLDVSQPWPEKFLQILHKIDSA